MVLRQILKRDLLLGQEYQSSLEKEISTVLSAKQDRVSIRRSECLETLKGKQSCEISLNVQFADVSSDSSTIYHVVIERDGAVTLTDVISADQ